MIVVLAAVWFLAQTDTSTGLPGPVADITVGVGVLGVAFLFWRIQRSLVRGLALQLSECRAESRLSSWRQQVLMNACVDKGIKVTQIEWNPPHLVRPDGTLIVEEPDPKKGRA